MGLFDRFKTTPKWKNDDPKIRLEAIDEIDDQNILCEIAKNDSDINVRKKAVKRVARDNILFDIALNDSNQEIRAEVIKILPGTLGKKDIIIKSVLNISDENVLVDIAKNAKSTYARVTAVQKLVNNQSALTDIVKTDNDYQVRQEAIKYIKDQSVIIDVAKNDSSEYVRREAVFNSNLTDIDVLRDISDNDKHWSVSSAAKTRLQSYRKDELDDGLNNPNVEIRAEAIKSIPHLSSLKYGDSEIVGAVQNISDENVLVDIAKNAEHPVARVEAIKHIENQDALIDIVKTTETHTYGKVRQEAVKHIINQDVLIEIAKNDSDEYVRREAVLNPNLIDEDVLKDIADNDEMIVSKEAAIKLAGDDETALKEIVKENDAFEGADAVSKITDEEFLMEVVSDTDFYNLAILMAALDNPNLTNISFLEKMGEKENSMYVNESRVGKKAKQKLRMLTR